MKSLEEAIKEQVDLTVLDQLAQAAQAETRAQINAKFDEIEEKVTAMLEIVSKTDAYFRCDSLAQRHGLQVEIQRMIRELKESVA